MALFDISRPASGRASDRKIAKKANNTNLIRTTPTIKGGGSLIDRIASAGQFVKAKLGQYADEYALIQDERELEHYIDVAIDNGVIAIDTETTGLDPLIDIIAGVCIYTPGMKSSYIPINHVSYLTNNPIDGQLPLEVVRDRFKVWEENRIETVMFNADFDLRILKNQLGLHNPYCTWDCYIAQRILNENEDINKLKPLYTKYVLDGKEDAFTFEDFFKGIPFTLVPPKIAYLYAAHDPKITLELYKYQSKYLREDSPREDMRQMYWLMRNIEMPCVPVVAQMEDNGVSIDLEYQEVLSEKYNGILTEKLQAFHAAVEPFSDRLDEYRRKHTAMKIDSPINADSPQQLAVLFYDIMGFPVIDKKHPRGTGEEILLKMDSPVAVALLEYRKVEKLISTYIDKLPNCLNPNDGKIHCKFNQYGAKTGRFSSQDPNLQNIPSHNKDIRPMFVASPGYVLMSSDFSQQEPKCLAALCRQHGDPQMYNTFMEGKDLYSEIASKSFNKTYDECKEFNADGTTNKAGKERRQQAKSILLGVLYGRGVPSIAEQLNCSVEKAQAIKDSVFRAFPAIKKFESDSLNMAYELGYVTTVCGRKRRLPELQLDEYEFRWTNKNVSTDLLDFDSEEEEEIPERTIRKYLTQLHNCRFNEKKKVFERANKEGIWIVDNGAKIADATRQCVNARIQGSAADLTKLAMIDMHNNQRLKELGFRLLIQVHDEVIAECPEENMKECSELLAEVMSKSAEKILEMPIKCDVDLMYKWYGEKLNEKHED